MKPALRSEWHKVRTTRTVAGLFITMIGLLLLVVLLHGLGLPAADVATASKQLAVLFGWAGVFGPLFAGLAGAMSLTGEIRYGTIRPTLLVTPIRRQVLIAKTWASATTGFGFGLTAGLVVAGVGTLALDRRGILVRLDTADYVRIVVGSAIAAAMWGAIGVAVGAVVRSQVPALVGLVVWLLFVENVVVGDITGVGAVGRLLPGAAARAISGQQASTLLSPAAGMIALTIFVAAAVAAGTLAIEHHDFA